MFLRLLRVDDGVLSRLRICACDEDGADERDEADD